jgi:hypothetical protein
MALLAYLLLGVTRSLVLNLTEMDLKSQFTVNFSLEIFSTRRYLVLIFM